MSTAHACALPARLLSWSLFLLPALAQDPMPPGGPGGPGGRGPGGGMNQSVKVLDQFDGDGNGRLDAEERKAARAWLKENRPQRGRMGRGPGGPEPAEGEGERRDGAPKAGRPVAPSDVPSHPDRPLFDPDVVRTFFFEFPQPDWFEELGDFYRTDVSVPAKVVVDGVTYPDVGVGFRGNTSYMMAPGRKKSLDLAFDFANGKQTCMGVRNLDLLNCHVDASFLREAIHGYVANQFFPAPRVCLVRVVINGEDHGIYAAVQQFDKDFVQDHFGTTQGDRFKVPPDFSGNGGLRWLGEDRRAYARSYDLKSADTEAAWNGLIDLCAVLERTPTDQLETILPQHLDVDAMLWFLAMDNAVADDDGYHARASDYLLYRDPKGRFHAIPRDNNEILLAARGPGGGPGPAGPGGPPRDGAPGDGAGRPFPPPGAPGGGPGGQGGPGGRRGGPGSAASSPLQMANREDRPLLRRLLEVPAWKQRYLADLRVLATSVFSENELGARLERWRGMIDDVVKTDVHSLYGYEAFARSFAQDAAGKPADRSLMAVVARRRAAILDDPALQGAWPKVTDLVTTAKASADDVYALSVTCRAGGAKIAAVRLHMDKGMFGSFTTQAMFDDGQHGDGAKGDGVYGGALPAAPGGTTWRFWIEAVAAESGHVDCLPAGNGARPIVWSAPKKAGPKKR